MRAVVIERPHEAAYREVETPACGPDDVLVRSHEAGVCRTDVDVLTGVLDRRWVRYPCIPGHEWAGSVAEAGGTSTTTPRVTSSSAKGSFPVSAARGAGPATRTSARTTTSSASRDPAVTPNTWPSRATSSTGFRTASLSTPPYSLEPASVVLAGLERSRPVAEETVGVVGVGTLGSLAIALIRLFAPAAVIAYGVRDEELELARRLGADHTVDVTGDAEGETRRLFGGGLDLVVETAGAVSAVELATRLLREGGRAVLLGIAGEGKTLELPADRLALRALDLIGSVGYARGVWARVVDLLAHGVVHFDGIVTHRFPASEFEAAFDLIENRRGIVGKIVLEHGEGK